MQRFNTLLNQPELTMLRARTQETQTAQKIWEAIAPDNLAQLSHASSIKNQQFTVIANNNAVAAKIKLFIPSLLIKLEKQGCEVTAIRVKVQVKSTPPTKTKTLKKLSAHAASNLNQLAEKISGTTLGDALARLAKKAD
ncbi:MAG TPA: DciA family protein [Methylotenera sp.]|nr:DciA family protein [Methylotenera sp.]